LHKIKAMRKIIELEDKLVLKLKMLSVFENLSVKGLMERAISVYVENKEKDRLQAMSKEEKEDLGLLLLMQQADTTEVVKEDEVFDYLDK